MKRNLTILLMLLLAFAASVSAGERKSNYELRILNHWDNPDGKCERGFAGRSIFWKENGVANLDVIKEYGRMNQEIGINGTVLNNVNAKPLMLSTAKLKEVKRIADALRPYGIKVYLSVNFASSKVLGKLPTADPLDKKVQQWWQKKAKEIYKMIPDFGGFLVKANSEGEPGPMDYGRTHVDGANMLAKALAPYGGIVMWRAFVYAPQSKDRSNQAREEFERYDGQFADNVIIQIKNGPVDFQPLEPVNPLFYGLKKTKMMAELQITQEYTGESIHTCYLGTMWEEFLADINTKDVATENIVGVAGVSNIADGNIYNSHLIKGLPLSCGSIMAQANWYAFGKLLSDTKMSSEQIAREFLAKELSQDEVFLKPVTRLMMNSWQAVVHYMMPLGLHHIFAGNHHYGPEPWYAPKGTREDWLPRYYHKAAKDGIGFNRTTAGGSANTRQYPDQMFAMYNDINTCPEQLLLWFHHVAWDHRMHNGETLWDALCHTYDQGVREAAAMHEIWKSVKPYVDAEMWQKQEIFFARQAKDAVWWRDACLLYFQEFSGMPFPMDCPKPTYTLEELKKVNLGIGIHDVAPFDKMPK